MTEMTRRTALTGVAAVAAAAALSPIGVATPVRAAAPAAGKQAPGWYRYKVGSFEITVATDGANRMKLPDDFVKNATRDEVNSALAAAYMEKDVFVGPYNPVVVNTGQKLVLIDTGTSEAAYKSTNGMSG